MNIVVFLVGNKYSVIEMIKCNVDRYEIIVFGFVMVFK